MIEKIRYVLGLVISVFTMVFGMYLFSLLPKLLITFKHFMCLAGGTCCVVGGAALCIFCLIEVIEG